MFSEQQWCLLQSKTHSIKYYSQSIKTTVLLILSLLVIHKQTLQGYGIFTWKTTPKDPSKTRTHFVSSVCILSVPLTVRGTPTPEVFHYRGWEEGKMPSFQTRNWDVGCNTATETIKRCSGTWPVRHSNFYKVLQKVYENYRCSVHTIHIVPCSINS